MVFLLDLEIEKKYSIKRTKSKYQNTCLVDIKRSQKKIREYLGITDADFELLENYNIIVEAENLIKIYKN